MPIQFAVRTVRYLVFLGAVVLSGSLLMGCDSVPAPDPVERPTVRGLQVEPSRVRIDELPADQVGDSLAQVNLRLSAEAEDPDGQVAKVVFTIEPASNPRGTVTGTLAPADSTRYTRKLGLSVPTVDDVYTVRVFSVDDDSLASNQAVGRLRVVPD